jgi:alkanesulfonate monooxygenase SsuD/methylene tetrahydromethanopterin reductase-like flavin-dependent oxidoreductase (luciferase family)
VIVERWHGLPWDHPVGRMREYITLVRRLLDGERVKHDGLYKLNGAQLATPPNGRAPIFLGALNRRMLELAGEIGDGVILNFPTLSYARSAIGHIETGIRKAGRQRADVNITAFIRTTVTDDPTAVTPRYRSELLTYVLAPVYRKVFSADGYAPVCDAANDAWAAGDRPAASAAVTDAMIHDHSVIGTAEDCARRFQEFRELGIDNAVVFPIPEPSGTTRDSVLRTIRALAP